MNKRTKLQHEALQKLASDGVLPAEFLLNTMRDESKDYATRIDAAKAAAPYFHPKLASIELTGDEDNPIQHSTRIEYVVIDPKAEGTRK